MVRNYSIYPRRKIGFLQDSNLTTKLILINVILYILSLFVLGTYGEKFFLDNLALTPSLILSGEKLWTIITSMFMHGSFFHLFANMFSLFFIGNFLEKILGKKRFFCIYIISGILGSIFFIFAGQIFGALNIPAVGASGAIFGLLGVLAVLVPYSKIYLIAGPLLLMIAEVLLREILPTSLVPFFSLIINILFFVSLFAIFSLNEKIRRFAFPIELSMWMLPIIAIIPLTIISFFIDLPIGNSAHLGGLVAGLFYGFYLRNKFPNKIRSISNHFS